MCDPWITSYKHEFNPYSPDLMLTVILSQVDTHVDEQTDIQIDRLTY